MTFYQSFKNKTKNFLKTRTPFLVEKTRPMRQRWANFKSEKPRLALAIKISSVLAFLAFLFVFSLVLLTYSGAFGKLPTYTDLKAIQNNVASEVYSEDGVLLGKYFVENRVNADFEEMSPNLINALVATEDARFFEHSGIDFWSWGRVLLRTILMQDNSGGGGSTLSQQLAKNLYKREDFMMLSMPIVKIKEMFIARRLEGIYTKEELLNLYLNTVPFGSNIYGVKVASQQFFNTSPKDLKVEEAAVLVGMLKANTAYNPVKNPKRSQARRNTVMQQMVKYNYLDAAAFDTLKTQPIRVSYYKEGNNQGIGTYFREHLRLEIADFLNENRAPNGKKYNLYTDGLKIYTTINARMQRYAEEAVHEHLSQLQADYFKHWKGKKSYGSEELLQSAKEKTDRFKKLKKRGLSAEAVEDNFNQSVQMSIFDYKNGGEIDTLLSPNDSLKYYLSILNTGFLATDPHTGKILAWVGGVDHQYFQYDHTQAQRQVGSIFKPLVYAQALKNKIPPCDYISNLQVTYTEYENWKPRNSDGKYGGVYSMEGALSHSVNAATVDLMLRTGVDSVRQLAQQMGIASEIPNVPAISLGAVDASLWEMMSVYNTFANNGKRPEMHYLTRIETADGEVVANFETPNPEEFEQVFSDSIAQMMTTMLQSVVDSGTARRLRYRYGLYNDIAGKTGTTQGHSDGWFMGYTPHLVAGVWVGGSSPQIRFKSMKLGQGANTALPIWAHFMNKVYKDTNFKKWKKQQFAPLDSTLIWEMNCPPFLEDRNMIPGLYEEEEEEGGIFDWFQNPFEREKEEARREQVRQRNGVSSQRSREIEERNQRMLEKRKKKKKRKKVFDKIFGRGN